jgi:hypothetical protein
MNPPFGKDVKLVKIMTFFSAPHNQCACVQGCCLTPKSKKLKTQKRKTHPLLEALKRLFF